MRKPHGAPHHAADGSRLQIVLIQMHVPVRLGQAGRDQGKQVLRVGRGLDVIGAVHIHHVEAALRHAAPLQLSDAVRSGQGYRHSRKP